jgi:two-component system, cell cycle sensor histidine kinase and response regulator CckA
MTPSPPVDQDGRRPPPDFLERLVNEPGRTVLTLLPLLLILVLLALHALFHDHTTWIVHRAEVELTLLVLGATGSLLVVLAVRRASERMNRDLVQLQQLVSVDRHPRILTDLSGRILFVNPAFQQWQRTFDIGPGISVDTLGLRKAEAQEVSHLLQRIRSEDTVRGQLTMPTAGKGPADVFDVQVSRVTAPRADRLVWLISPGSPVLEVQPLLEAIPQAAAVLGSGDRIRAMNRRWAVLFDRQPHVLAGATPRTLFAAGEIDRITAPDNDGRELETRITMPNGSQIAVGVIVRRQPASGQTWLFVRPLFDELRRREALKRIEQRFQRFFAFAPIGIALLDSEFRLVECNPTLTRMAGTQSDHVRGRDIGVLLQEDQRPLMLARLAAALKGAAADDPFVVRLGGERQPTVHVYVRRIDEDDESGVVPGDGPGLVLHVVDVTDQKNLEAQFAQSQKMQAVGQLAGGVAHDFNNLLTAIIGFADLLLLRHRPGDPAFSDLMQIQQNANRAANLVRQLLAFSRQQTLQPQILDLTDVLAELSNLLRRLIGEKITLTLRHDRALAPVKVDQGQFEQVIINLAVNARDAMPEGGRLTITTRNLTTVSEVNRASERMPPGDYVVVEVSDTGTGIALAEQQRIFEPFYTTKPAGLGTGLGLSTAYGIVRQTGGFIFVDSVPGEGATFGVYLPRHHITAAEPLAIRPPEPPATDLTGRETLLLVEDEDPVRVFGARALRNKGYTVIEARDGESALTLLRDPATPAIDLIITDVVMPHLDGPGLIRAVRSFQPDIKVVFISGYAEEQLRDSLEDTGALLPKPFTLKQLAAKVKEALSR